ncbi:MAG: chloramphenicol resistance protein [Acutalibacteraceae bacterium]|nr:chloramphenicol resistance protein [Acutalibacteraceae bacterium]
MTIIESVKNFIMTCPFLAELARVNVDFLPENSDTYSIEEVPSQIIIKEYLDGSSERQFVFVFAARLNYSDELRTNIDNSGFFEDFAEWLEKCTREEVFPEMKEGLTPSKIEAISSGYLFDISGDLTKSRYQIQCRLIYDKE